MPVKTKWEIVISYRDHKTEAFFVPRAQPEVRKEPRFHGRAYERYFIHRETDAHSGTKRYTDTHGGQYFFFSYPCDFPSTFSYFCECQSTFSHQRYEKLKMLGGADTRIRVFIGLQVDKLIFIPQGS